MNDLGVPPMDRKPKNIRAMPTNQLQGMLLQALPRSSEVPGMAVGHQTAGFATTNIWGMDFLSSLSRKTSVQCMFRKIFRHQIWVFPKGFLSWFTFERWSSTCMILGILGPSIFWKHSGVMSPFPKNPGHQLGSWVLIWPKYYSSPPKSWIVQLESDMENNPSMVNINSPSMTWLNQ